MENRSLIGRKEIEEYRKFAFRDDVFKLTVGVILGNSFNKVVFGVSDYLVMPVFTFLVSKTGEHWREWTFEPVCGLKFELGRMAGVFVDFLLISVVLYLFYVKLWGTMFGAPEQTGMKRCGMCFSAIDERSTRCPKCAGVLNVETGRARGKDKGAKDRRGKQQGPSRTGG